VGLPIATALARRSDTEVWGLARFRDPAKRADLESRGIKCFAMDLATDEPIGLPEDFDYVLNFGVVTSRNYQWTYDLDANAGGLGVIASHCRSAKALLHCSSTNVYRPNGNHLLREDDPLSDTPRTSDLLATYTISKIASEAMARFCARHMGIPTTIARLNVPYGPNGGWMAMHLAMILGGESIPIYPGAPNVFNPIHESDIVATLPGLLAAAGQPATVVNWAGSEPVSIEEWCQYIGQLVQRPARFITTDTVVQPTPIDVTRMHELVGKTTMPWRTGVRAMVAALAPDISLAEDDPPVEHTQACHKKADPH
jgi:nucleoside-diphosphate-sugar epimerase